MSLKETVKKYTIRIFLVVVSGFLLLLNGIQPAEMASLPTISQINRMQELTPLYQAYKLELKAGTIEKILSFDNYVDRNPEYKKVYKGVILFGHEFPGNRIEIRGVEEKSKELILYDDSSTPDLDWFKGSKKSPPNENDLR